MLDNIKELLLTFLSVSVGLWVWVLQNPCHLEQRFFSLFHLVAHQLKSLIQRRRLECLRVKRYTVCACLPVAGVQQWLIQVWAAGQRGPHPWSEPPDQIC